MNFRPILYLLVFLDNLAVLLDRQAENEGECTAEGFQKAKQQLVERLPAIITT
jgi:hypothetical protein